jgi:AcrR family transcriptional regulator
MDKRRNILEATSDLIAGQGLQNCPMSMIAKHAGCGAGTIYRYFETKEDLVLALFTELSNDMAESCLQGYDESSCIKQRFFTFWGNFYRFMHETPRNQTLIEQLSACPAISQELRDQAMNKVIHAGNKLMDDGKAQLLIKNMPNEILKTMTFGSLMMISKKQHMMPDMFPEPVSEQDLLTMCWDAVKA